MLKDGAQGWMIMIMTAAALERYIYPKRPLIEEVLLSKPWTCCFSLLLSSYPLTMLHSLPMSTKSRETLAWYLRSRILYYIAACTKVDYSGKWFHLPVACGKNNAVAKPTRLTCCISASSFLNDCYTP